MKNQIAKIISINKGSYSDGKFFRVIQEIYNLHLEVDLNIQRGSCFE